MKLDDHHQRRRTDLGDVAAGLVLHQHLERAQGDLVAPGFRALAAGIDESLLRIAVGLEAVEDLQADLERGLGQKWLAVVFCIFTAVAAFGIGNTVQSNSVADLAHKSLHVPEAVTGIILVAVAARRRVHLAGGARLGDEVEEGALFGAEGLVGAGFVLLHPVREPLPGHVRKRRELRWPN